MAEKKQKKGNGGFVGACVKIVERWMPDAFIFAVILSIVIWVFTMVVYFATVKDVNVIRAIVDVIYKGWYGGFWGLLAFSMQMSLVVVTGSMLAKTPAVDAGLRKLANLPKTPFAAIWLITFVCIVVEFVNWGAGLVVGAIIARHIARKLKGVDYAMMIAAGYIGVGMWHGGFSGSIPLAVAAEGWTVGAGINVLKGGELYGAIAFDQTLFSPYNLIIYIGGLVILPLVMGALHPKDASKVRTVDPALLVDEEIKEAKYDKKNATPAEKMEHSYFCNYFMVAMGLISIFMYFYNMAVAHKTFSLDLNIVNFMMLVAAMALYKTPIRVVKAVEAVAGGAAGVILQFPFYGGISGMMTYAGAGGLSLAAVLSNFFINISNGVTFPLFVWLSAGIVNFFVPSGGGQWNVQGPIVAPAAQQIIDEEAAQGLHRLSMGKALMAIAWGDCWTNLIQPFWALPMLAIAKLSARDIMGYCIVCLLVLGVIIAIGMILPL